MVDKRCINITKIISPASIVVMIGVIMTTIEKGFVDGRIDKMTDRIDRMTIRIK